MADERPAFQVINDLFAKHGLDAPPWKLRDELATHLLSHRRQPEAREGEAVGYANAEFMRRLKNWRDVMPNSIRSDETFLKAVASESYPVPLFTHPAAPSDDKLRIAVEAMLPVARSNTGIGKAGAELRAHLDAIDQALAAPKAEGA